MTNRRPAVVELSLEHAHHIEAERLAKDRIALLRPKFAESLMELGSQSVIASYSFVETGFLELSARLGHSGELELRRQQKLGLPVVRNSIEVVVVRVMDDEVALRPMLEDPSVSRVLEIPHIEDLCIEGVVTQPHLAPHIG